MKLSRINIKNLILIGLLILVGIGIWFAIQTEKAKPKQSKMSEILSNISIESKEKKKPEIILISVYDNYQVNPELTTDWGFATIIKTPQELILFDTGGDSKILLSNMKKLGINPSSIKKVVISHIHSDHLGGLEGFLERNSNVTVFIPKSFPCLLYTSDAADE